MPLSTASAISYNKSRLYSQKAIGIIQYFCNCHTTGLFDKQTVQAVYKMQQSPLFGFAAGVADGKVGPSTLGVMIMELDNAMRKQEADVLRAYAYKINGVMQNSSKDYPAPAAAPAEKEADQVEDDGDNSPTQARPQQLLSCPGGAVIHRHSSGAPFLVGGLYLSLKDIRKILCGDRQYVYYVVIQTESAALDPFLVGKVYRQTVRGFTSDIDNAWTAEVGRRSQGGQAMMKKEVELMMGAVCACVGAYGGFAAVTASAMQFLLMNSKDLFKAADGIKALMKVRAVLSQNTPEFWRLCVTVLKLSIAKTPEAVWSDQYGSTKLIGELVMIVGEAVLLKKVKSLGLVAAIASKVMLGAFGKLSDAATIALAGKDLVATMREYDPTIDQAKAQRIVVELRDNWDVVGPALNAFKAAVDQMVGA